MATRSTLEGVAQLTKQLQSLGKLDDGKALRSAVRNGMQPAFERFQQSIAVGTEAHRSYVSKKKREARAEAGINVKGQLLYPGYARDHIKRATTVNSDKNIASCVLTVNKLAYYVLKFVELGTRYQRPQPMLRNAFSETRDAGEEKLRASLEKSVAKAIRDAGS